MYSIQLLLVALCCFLFSTGALVWNYKINLEFWMNEFRFVKKDLEIWSTPKIEWNQREKTRFKSLVNQNMMHCSFGNNAHMTQQNVLLDIAPFKKNPNETNMNCLLFFVYGHGRIEYLSTCSAHRAPQLNLSVWQNEYSITLYFLTLAI